MPRLKSENFIGKTYERLTIENLVYKQNSKGKNLCYALCRCSCGKTSTILLSSLLNSHTKSCGCLNFNDLTGIKFGLWTVISLTKRNGNSKHTYWSCRCECGTIRDVRHSSLSGNKTKSCGCLSEVDFSGRAFGNLVVIGKIKNEKSATGLSIWECKCICGSTCRVNTQNLTSGDTKSCGCLRYSRGKKHPSFKGYEEISGTFMIRLKRNTKRRTRILELDVDAKYLWELFLEQEKQCALSGLPLTLSNDMQTASLDRINPEKGYIKGNVQWVHKDINIMKNDYSDKRFIEICCFVADKQRNKII